jgi:hypothetical protein
MSEAFSRKYSSRGRAHPKIADKRNMEDHSFGLRSCAQVMTGAFFCSSECTHFRWSASIASSIMEAVTASTPYTIAPHPVPPGSRGDSTPPRG